MVVYGPPLPPFGGRSGVAKGSVFTAKPKERILKRFGKDYYRLSAFAFFSDVVDRYADKLRRQTDKKVKVAPVWDKRVNRGAFVDYGIWVSTGHTTRMTKGRTKGRKKCR